MKKTILIAIILTAKVGWAQTLVTEKKIPLTKEQQKNEMEFALRNSKTEGVTVFFESQKGEKVKGQGRTYKRFETALDKDLNVVEAEYKTLGTKNAVRPRIMFPDFRIGYTTWVDDETEDKIDKMMLQIIKFDNSNKILEIKDYELCEEAGFDNYQITSYQGELVVLTQYEKKKTKNKEEKNRDYVIMMRINPSTMEVSSEKELNLLGKDELGLEAFLISNNKMFLVGKQLHEIAGIKFPKAWLAFRLSLDGEEEARGNISMPQGLAIANLFLRENNGTLYMAGEYGDAKKAQQWGAAAKSARKGNVMVKNQFLGMFIKKFDLDLNETATATFDYEEKMLKKLKKGNPGFKKKNGNYNLQDFYFLEDGSFYITAEMFTKEFITTESQAGALTIRSYSTAYTYMDGLVFKFNSNGELDWLVQIDKDNYRKVYSGHLKALKPVDPGKLESFLLDKGQLALFYNTPGRKYNKKRFGLSEVIVSPDGTMSNAIDFTSNAEFGLLDGGIIPLDNNTVMAIGTDKKEDYLWVKKIRLQN